MQHAFRDSTYTVLGKMTAFAASFATVTIFGRVIPREVAGSYNYVMAALAIISIATLPGMNNALTRAVGRGHDNTVSHMMRKRLMYGSIGSIIAIIIGLATIVRGDTRLGMAFCIAAPFVPLTDTFSNLAFSFWQGKKRFDKSALMEAGYYIGLAVFSIPLYFLTHNLLLIVTGVMLAQTVMGIVVHKSIRKATATVDDASVALGMHLTAMQAMSILVTNIDRVLVWHLFGPAMVAIYSFASTPVSKASQMVPFGIVSLPHLSGQTFTREIKKDIARNIFRLFAISIPAVGIIIWCAPAIYHLLFPLYPESVPYFRILFAGMAFAPLALVHSAFVAFHKVKYLYILEVALPIFKIALMILLALLYGIYGLVCATLLMSVVGAAVSAVLFIKTPTAAEAGFI